MDRGLPEPEYAEERLPGAIFARQDVITCRFEDRVGAVRERVEASPYRFALVLADGGVLLGRLRKAALNCDAEATAETVMEPDPRPSAPIARQGRVRGRLQPGDLTTAVITDPDGALLDVVRRSELPTMGDDDRVVVLRRLPEP